MRCAGWTPTVNMCGVNVGAKRWSGAFKQSLRDSRIDPTEVLSEAVAEAGVGVLVNASAVGYYGDTGNRIADETAPSGRGFLAQLCRDWEAATAPAQHAGVRVVLTRTGLVLSPRGGMLSRLRPLFSLGLGARLGSGRQYMPWISLEDQVRALLFAIFARRRVGPGELHRACAGDQLRVHDGDGPYVEPADAPDGSGFRAEDVAGRVRRGRAARRAAGDSGGARTCGL